MNLCICMYIFLCARATMKYPWVCLYFVKCPYASDIFSTMNLVKHDQEIIGTTFEQFYVNSSLSLQLYVIFGQGYAQIVPIFFLSGLNRAFNINIGAFIGIFHSCSLYIVWEICFTSPINLMLYFGLLW